MKLLSIAILSGVLLGAPSSSVAIGFTWSISGDADSPLEPFDYPVGGPIDLYLWLCDFGLPHLDGLTSAEFRIEGTIIPIGFVPDPGWTVSGTFPDLLLTATGCPEPWTRAGTISAMEPIEGGEMCIVPSSNVVNASTPCQEVNPVENLWRGYSSQSIPSCGNGQCHIIPVDPSSWGEIKSEYH